MLLLIFQVFLAVTIAKSAFEESLEPNDTMISETFAQISRISLGMLNIILNFSHSINFPGKII